MAFREAISGKEWETHVGHSRGRHWNDLVSNKPKAFGIRKDGSVCCGMTWAARDVLRLRKPHRQVGIMGSTCSCRTKGIGLAPSCEVVHLGCMEESSVSFLKISSW